MNICKLFMELLVFFQFAHLCPLVEDIVFSWIYNPSIASILYKPAMVFKNFPFWHLLHEESTCACNSVKRLSGFLDPLTLNETSCFTKTSMHVWSMDIAIVQNNDFRMALKQGLNHILLRPTNIAEAIAIVLDAFDQLVTILSSSSLKILGDVQMNKNTYMILLITAPIGAF